MSAVRQRSFGHNLGIVPAGFVALSRRNIAYRWLLHCHRESVQHWRHLTPQQNVHQFFLQLGRTSITAGLEADSARHKMALELSTRGSRNYARQMELCCHQFMLSSAERKPAVWDMPAAFDMFYPTIDPPLCPLIDEVRQLSKQRILPL